MLVSLLELDNELYNTGIVDVSYKYEKMYVIRPQFFIPLITILRNAAMNTLKYRRELSDIKNPQYLWEQSYGFSEFIIDKTIDDCRGTRMECWIRNVGCGLQMIKLSISVKKITYGNPVMQVKFDALNKPAESDSHDN